MNHAGRICSVLGLVLGLYPVSGLAQDAPDLAEVRAAIDSGNSAYVAAYAHVDATALARVYDTEGARLSDNGRTVRGREAIAASVGAFLSQVGPVHVRLETVDVWVIEDQAYETGIWSYTYTPAGATKRTIGGRYVTVWRQQSDGGWRILADLGVPGTSLPDRNNDHD